MNENFYEPDSENPNENKVTESAETENINETVGAEASAEAENYAEPPKAVLPPTPVYRSEYATVISEEERVLKKDMRRLSWGIALPFTLLCVVPYILSYGLRYILNITVGSAYTYSLFSSEVFALLFDAFMTITLFTLPFLITPAVTRGNLREAVSFNKPKENSTLGLVMLGLGVCCISNMASSYFIAIVESIFGTSVGTSTNYGANDTRFFISIFAVGILPAIFEEFALRGVVLGTLRRYFGDGVAILISAALFGLMHGNIRQIPFAMGVGLVLGFAVCYSGSIFPAMLIHSLNNLLSVLLQYACGFLSPTVEAVVTRLYSSAMIIVGVCGFLILLKTDENIFKLGGERTENTGKKLRFFLPFAPMIVYSVIQTIDIIKRL